jgi:hypothetical protein
MYPEEIWRIPKRESRGEEERTRCSGENLQCLVSNRLLNLYVKTSKNHKFSITVQKLKWPHSTTWWHLGGGGEVQLLFFLNLGTRRLSGQCHSGCTLPPGKWYPVAIVQEAQWAPLLVWMQKLKEKSSVSVRDRNPVIQSIVKTVYWMTYLARLKQYSIIKNLQDEHQVLTCSCSYKLHTKLGAC